nr:helix-turn-helix domain-containing protein [Ralstonia mannitolilytica]
MTQPETLLTREQVAAMLGIKTQTLAKWACTHRHNLPFVKVGSAVRYRRNDVEAFIARQTVVIGNQEATSL